MNSVQVHLALTHVPVILSFAGLIMLLTAFIIKNTAVTKTSYVLLVVAGIASIPVFLTGEGTEEAIENLPGVSESIIERHEEIANFAMIAISIAGLAALTALFSSRWNRLTGIFKVAVLVLAITSGVLMGKTAQLGGQIRHTEIRDGVAMQTDAYPGTGNDNKSSHQHNNDD